MHLWTMINMKFAERFHTDVPVLRVEMPMSESGGGGWPQSFSDSNHRHELLGL